ncbi:MAG: phosphate transport system regulatory protein PhoU, partial [Acidobacteria bacterium]|nr:phosphate transport system regulatory protein PhoU [Acidobacteriota bacterium]
SLERMGDLARHVAQLARLRFPAKVIPDTLTHVFDEMAALDLEISKDVTELLETRELALVEKISKANMRINDLHRSVFAEIAKPEWDASPVTTVDVTLASRYFERFGDHGVSVARKVAYLVTGQWQPEGYAH